MRIFEAFDFVVSAFEDVLARIAAAIMFFIMVIVVIDVTGRYFFNSPLDWSYELTTLYLMSAVFFFSLSPTMRHEHHVRVDILFNYVSVRTRSTMKVIGYVLSIVLFALIFSQGLKRAWSDWASDGIIDGAFAWPTWVSSAIVPLGVGLLTLRLVQRLIQASVAVVAPNSTLGRLEHELQELAAETTEQH